MAKDTADGRGYDAVKQTMKWISGFCIEKGILINSEKSNNRWGRFILIWKEKRHMKISTDMFAKKIKCDAAKVEECTKKIYKLCKVTRVSSFSVVSKCYFCKWNKRRGKKCVIQKQCYVLSPWNHFHKKWQPQDSLPKSPLQFGDLSFINFILFSERPQKLCLELSNNF